MTEKTAWADLPNAKHIDRVIASVRQNPEKWKAAYDAAWKAAYDAAWKAVWGSSRELALAAARNVARDAAWGAIIALIAYDDCAYLPDQNPDHVKVLAGLGVESAVLLLPAVIALNNNT